MNLEQTQPRDHTPEAIEVTCDCCGSTMYWACQCGWGSKMADMSYFTVEQWMEHFQNVFTVTPR